MWSSLFPGTSQALEGVAGIIPGSGVENRGTHTGLQPVALPSLWDHPLMQKNFL